MQTITIKEALDKAFSLLKKAKIDSAALDAEVLLAHVLKKDRVFLFAYPEKKLTTLQHKSYTALIKKRSAHTPLAYLTGHKEFFNLDFITQKGALIPRPETEELVERVIEYCKQHPHVKSLIDVGTGSGAIAVALAKNLPASIKITAVDSSLRALTLAKKNSRKLKIATRITFKKSNLLSGINNNYDIIIANLPYVSEKEYARAIKLYPEIKQEPKTALLAKDKGLALIERLLKQSPEHISKNGAIFLEIGYEQGQALKKLASKYLPNSKTEIIKDLCGRDRIAVILA